MTTTLEWFGCATFRMRTAGLTVFLDAYVDRAADAAGPRVRADDITECDWIVIGHSHFDHLYGAERIMANTSATLIGSYETVRVMAQAGVPEDRMVWVAGGETVRLSDDVTVRVLPSQHSCVWSHAQMAQPADVCLGDLGVTWHEQRARMTELQAYLAGSLSAPSTEHLLASLVGHSHRGDGGAFLYLFDTPDGSLLFQDTSGHWSGIIEPLRPDVAILAAAGRANVDGEPIQGSMLDFLRAEVDALRPARTVLCHHDDWLPGFSVPTDMAPLRELFAASASELVELEYVTPTAVLP